MHCTQVLDSAYIQAPYRTTHRSVYGAVMVFPSTESSSQPAGTLCDAQQLVSHKSYISAPYGTMQVCCKQKVPWPLRCALVPMGAYRNALVSVDDHWCVLAPTGLHWSLWVHVGPSGLHCQVSIVLQVCNVPSWSSLTPVGPHWSPQVRMGPAQVPVKPDTCRP